MTWARENIAARNSRILSYSEGPGAAAREAQNDAGPERAGLYTTVKADHPELWPSEEPCDCEQCGDRWERLAMRVAFPRTAARELEAGS
jgi:hypothetical protein